MATEKQIAANRQNAQHSTGPNTPEGKILASQNSLKHGLFARHNVIKDEDPADFDRHRRGLLSALRPADPMELLLADRIVALAWRLLRTNRMQTETIAYLFPRHTYESVVSTRPPVRVEPEHPLGRIAVGNFEPDNLIINRLLIYENRLERAFYRACLELKKRQAARADSNPTHFLPLPQPALLPEPQEQAIEKTNPILTTP